MATPFDAGNELLGEVPAQMSAALIGTPAGQRLVLTIRTASTTMTVLLGKQDAVAWLQNLKAAADSMSSAGLVVAGPAMPVMPGASGNGKAPK